MESFLVLIAIAIVVMPIVSVVMLSGLGSRISQMEESVRSLKETLHANTVLLRDLLGDAPVRTEAEPAQTPPQSDTPPIPSMPAEPEPAAQIPFHPAPPAETEETALPEEQEKLWEDDLEFEPVYAQSAEDLPGNEAPPAYLEPESAKPSWLAEYARRASTWLLKEGNIWVSIGVLLFLAGFGLLFSYVAQMGLVSLEMRLAGSAAFGIAMAAFGWRMRERRRTYALILQGGGIGVLYIVLLAAAKLGPVLPVPAAVVGMLLLCTFTILLALLQDFELLALFALLGGFAAPVLLSSGSNNFVALFSIYSLLNLEILFIATQRNWAKIRWGGLLASAVVGAVWGCLRWQADFFAQVEPFLILLFVTYSAVTLVPVLSASSSSKWLRNRGSVDVPMLLTLPFVFLFLQMAAAAHTKYGVALSCLALGAWYLAAGRFTMRNEQARAAGLSPGLLLTYCIVFSNLAVPFIFKQAVSSAIWAVEGAVLVAYAAREKKGYGTLACGIFLHLAAFVLYNLSPYLHLPGHLYELPFVQSGLLDWRNETSPFLLTGILFAISALASSYFATRFQRDGASGPMTVTIPKVGFTIRLPEAPTLAWALSAYATVWWTLSVYHAVFVGLEGRGITAFSILCAGSIAGYLASVRLNWSAARILSVPPIASVLLLGLCDRLFFGGRGAFTLYYGWFDDGVQIFSDLWQYKWLNLATFAGMFAAAVYTYRRDDRSRLRQITWGVVLFSFLYHVDSICSSTVSWDGTTMNAELGLLLGFLPTVAASALLTLRRFSDRTGLAPYARQSHIALCLVLLTRLPALLLSLGHTETGIGSFYIPVANPLELWQILYLASAGLLLNALDDRLEKIRRIGLRYALPFVGFLLVNSIAARAAYRYFGERVSWGYISHAPHFQGLIAMLWGLTALALIFGGQRYARRFPWFLGAGLLAADIAKLMLIDLRNSATVIRILAFLLLGGLFLLIGWIAPLPPKLEAVEADAADSVDETSDADEEEPFDEDDEQ